MKKLFKAIRDNNLDLVQQLITGNPELVNCISNQPPKKDDGQSPLQIALKTSNFDIAEYLINNGANLNFMEDESCTNAFRSPVVHDAINAAVMSSRWNTNNPISGLKIFSTEEKALRSRKILEKMLQSGSDLNKLDSAGNSGIWRFCLQASQILPSFNYATQSEYNDKKLTTELEADLLNILKLLLEHGANINYVHPNTGLTIKDFYTNGSISKLLTQVK